MNFIEVTALKMDQENQTFISTDKIISVGTITLTLPVAGTENEEGEPETEERTMTVINLNGCPAIFVKQTPQEVMDLLKTK